MFQQMVDLTEPLCQAIDASLAQILTFDTSGIELYVTENNPKTLNALIRKLKVFYKDNPSVDPYKMAYALMPSQSAASSDAKHMSSRRESSGIFSASTYFLNAWYTLLMVGVTCCFILR